MAGRPRPPVPVWLDLRRLTATTPRDGWQQRAACIGENPSLFFPEKGRTDLIADAKDICRRCTAVYACLAANLDCDFGVFGRTTVDERKSIRRALAQREQVA